MTKDQKYRRRLKRRAVIQLGGRCHECGGGPPFEFHHIKGGGDLHRAAIGRGSDRIHRYVLRGGDHKIVLLCETCHKQAHGKAA